MSTLDHFESAFRSASKDTFDWAPPALAKVLVATDLDAEAAARYEASLRQLLSATLAAEAPTWRTLAVDDYADIAALHGIVGEWQPDLVCTYRNLHSSAWSFQYSLGETIHVLTQATTTPVLVTPHPRQTEAASHALRNTDVVMAMTDHLSGSERLVNYAAAMTQPEGKLWLAHVEDELAFDRTIEVISKIPQIDTDSARELIRAKLLQEPTDYVEACHKVIANHRPGLSLKPLVVMGHRLATYRQLIRDHEVDLLVMNTKDDDQLAMHGMAYPIAVELREIPLLLL